jgi:hypothetical protein
MEALTIGDLYYMGTLPVGNPCYGETLTSQNLAKARGDGWHRVADPATLRLRGGPPCREPEIQGMCQDVKYMDVHGRDSKVQIGTSPL